ncbi:hypothetical protein EON65_06890 [archaeon]|nr:MAG: hypothetical protein EON65_06890 [archaeon]
MFRKKEHLQEKSRTLLKNKEIRGLRAWIQQEYPNLSECVLEETLPAKAAVTCIKLTNHTLLYSVNNSIYFYDLHGEKKVLFPSLLMLWKCPTMMRSMVTHGPVSRFVLRGADFMAPGLASMAGLEGLKKGEKVCLVSSRNPLPFAVGLSLIEVNGGSMGRQGLQGKAMQVLHYYGDCLLPEMRPNEGFTLAEILPVAGGVKSAAKSEAKEGKGEGEEEGEGEEREGTKPSENDTQEYGGVLGEADRQDPEAEEGIVSCAAGGELDETALVGKGKVAEEWEELIAGVEEVALGKNEREGNWDDDEGGEDDDENGGTGVDNDDESGGGDNTVDIEDIDNDDNEESGHEGECESSAPTSSSMVHSREAVDMQLERAVALAVRYVVKPAALPLLLSSFWKTLLRYSMSMYIPTPSPSHLFPLYM